MGTAINDQKVLKTLIWFTFLPLFKYQYQHETEPADIIRSGRAENRADGRFGQFKRYQRHCQPAGHGEPSRPARSRSLVKVEEKLWRDGRARRHVKVCTRAGDNWTQAEAAADQC